MQRFTDSPRNGSAPLEWDVLVNVKQIKLARDLAKVDLYNLFGDESARLFGDPVLLVNTLCVLCSEQIKARNMSEEEFGCRFDGTVLENASNVLLEEVLSFFPRSRQPTLRAMTTKSMQLAEEMQAKALEKINQVNLTDLLASFASPVSSV